MPVPVLFILVVSLSMVGTLALVLLARISHGRHRMTGTEDIETAYITALGTLYAIFLAFMIFVVWTRFYDAQEAVDQEANTLVDIHRLAAALPEPFRSELQASTVEYARTMVEREWPAMAEGERTVPSRHIVRRMWGIVNRMGPSSVPDFVLRDHVTKRLEELSDLRRTRLLHARTGLPHVLYAALFFGAIITLAVATFFTVHDFWPHAMKAAVVAAMLSFFLLTIWLLDHPFQGRVSVPTDAFRTTLSAMRDP